MHVRLQSSASALACLILSFLFFGGAIAPAGAQAPGLGAVVVSPDGKRVYVTDSIRGGIDMIDPATNQLVSTIPVFPEISLPGLAVSPDGSRLYVSAGPLGLLVVSPDLNGVVARVKVGRYARAVGVSPDGRRIYVGSYADNGSSRISVIDAASDQVTATLPIDGQPNSLAVRPDGRRVYVTSLSGSAPLTVIDAENNTVLEIVKGDAPVPAAASPAEAAAAEAAAVSPDGRRLYVSHDNLLGDGRIDVFDAASNRFIATLPGGFSPAVAVSPDSQRLYVLPQPWNIVAAIDPFSGQAAAVPVGQNPVSLAVSPDGRRVYVSNGSSQTLSVVDAITLQQIATVDLHRPR